MIDLQIINKILNTGNFEIASQNGLDTSYFPNYAIEFKFIADHYNRFGRVPDKATFLSHFPDFQLIDVSEPDKYLIEGITEEYVYNKSIPVLKEVERLLKSKQSVRAVEYLSAKLPALTCKTSLNATDIIRNAEDRVSELEKRAEGDFFITTGFAELDKALMGWQRGEDLVTIMGRTNEGKCLQKGTLVLMADGTRKKIEDICIGDKVQSEYGINTVIAIHNGISGGYRIKPRTGQSFIVSDNHILTFNRKIYNNGTYIKTIREEISIEEYVKRYGENSIKENTLIRPSVEYSEKILDTLPYDFGKSLKQTDSIPLAYLTSSKQQRLDLLSGIMDSRAKQVSGRKNTFEIIADITVKDDYIQLITGIGYGYDIEITGNTVKIYIILNKGANETTFKVKRLSKVEYYGFECDGDHRFLLADNTLIHNTWILLKFLEEAWKSGKRVGLYSGEMSTIQVGFRFDTIYKNFSNTILTRGSQEIGYFRNYINALKDKNSFFVITPEDLGGSATVTKLNAFIEKYNLDILGVDQYSLMDDESYQKNMPLRAKYDNISKGLFLSSCKYKIPILAAVQANRKASEKSFDKSTQTSIADGPKLEHISESDAIAHNSSRVIAIKQRDGNLEIEIVKNRLGGRNGKFLYRWLIDTGKFDYVPTTENMFDKKKIEEQKQKFKDRENIF